MDTRRFIMAMTLAMVAMWGFTLYNQSKLAKQQAAQSQPVAAATQPAGSQPGATNGAAEMSGASQPLWHAQGATAVQSVTLGQDDPEGKYDIQALLSNRGAAVERVLMVEKSGQKTKDGQPKYKYAEKVDLNKPYPLIEALALPDGRQVFSWQTAAVRLGNPEVSVPLSNVIWNVETRHLEKGVYEARFWVDIYQADQPIVRVVKRFTLAPNNFSMNMDLTFEPLNGAEVVLTVDQLGAVGIRREDPRSDLRKIYVVSNETNKAKTQVFQHASLAGKPPVEIGSVVPFWWTALVDKYFAAITAPGKAVGAARPVGLVKVFTYTPDPKAPDLGGDIAIEMLSPNLTATTAAPAKLTFDLYAGPKDPNVFAANPTYVARDYGILRSAEYAWCTFSSLGELLTLFLHWLYYYIPPHNYGVAIIILVLLVRALLHPLTKHQQISMAQMQARQATVQPKVAALKQKYGTDKQKLQVETMKVYREAGINPASQIAGCLPMLIQLPIWVALYSALNYDINLWHEPFAMWIKDLSAPDALYHWQPAVTVPLLSWILGPIDKFNVLPILLAISMYLQQKYTPKPPPAPGTPQEQIDQQAQMQKMMGFMMIFMGLLFYNMPSGLNLYIMASSFFGVLEQKRIRKHLEEQKNQTLSNQPAKRNVWMEKIMAKIEKKVSANHTIRKDKPS